MTTTDCIWSSVARKRGERPPAGSDSTARRRSNCADSESPFPDSTEHPDVVDHVNRSNQGDRGRRHATPGAPPAVTARPVRFACGHVVLVVSRRASTHRNAGRGSSRLRRRAAPTPGGNWDSSRLSRAGVPDRSEGRTASEWPCAPLECWRHYTPPQPGVPPLEQLPVQLSCGLLPSSPAIKDAFLARPASDVSQTCGRNQPPPLRREARYTEG